MYATGFPNFFTCRQKRRIQTKHTDNGKYVMTQLMKDTHPRLLNKRKRQQAATFLNSIGQLIRQKLPLYLWIENLVYSKSATIDLKEEIDSSLQFSYLFLQKKNKTKQENRVNLVQLQRKNITTFRY